MKIRKTRILKQTLANGKEVYWPQYKYLGFWFDFDNYEVDQQVYAIAVEWMKSKVEGGGVIEKTENSCKELVNFYIRHVNYINACNLENKVIKQDIIKWP